MQVFEFQEKTMPLYSTSAFAPLPEVAIPGKPVYFYGALNTDTDDTYLRVTNVALASNVATVTGTIYRGNIPAVGSLISIQGTKTSSGLFNVSGVALTAVSVAAATGVGTFTFALTGSDVSATADAGMGIVPIAETAETAADGTSVAIYVPSNELRDLGEKSITVATTFPSLPTAATVTLYAAINNNPDEYTSMGVVATVAAGAQTVGPLITFTTPAGRFFRLVASAVSGGTNPTMIAKMVC
jgi:hypothetical protein